MTAESKEMERALEQLQVENRTMQILMRHIGANRVVGMGELYESVYGEKWKHRINDTRPIREVVTKLRRDGVPICSVVSGAGGGYYLAGSAAELDEQCKRIEMQALKKLKQASLMRQLSLPELLGQLQTNLASYDTDGGDEGEGGDE